MKFSIIVPTFNSGHVLVDTISSIKNQDYNNYEVIIVDDGSTDDTSFIVEKLSIDFNNLNYIFKENGGVSSARNRGILESKGEFLLFLDSDDTLKPGTLRSLSEYLYETPDLLMFGMDFTYINNGELHSKVVKSHPNLCGGIEIIDKNFTSLFSANYLSSSCNKAINRKFIATNNIRFNENMNVLEDLEFTINCLEKSRNNIIISESFYIYNINIKENRNLKRSNIDYTKNFDILYETLIKFEKQLKNNKSIITIYNIIFRSYLKGIEIELNHRNIKESKEILKKYYLNRNFYNSLEMTELRSLKLRLLKQLFKKNRLFLIMIILKSKEVLDKIKKKNLLRR